MKKSDIDTVTNVILNNEYKLHEDEKAEENTEKEYIIKERTHKEKRNKHKNSKTKDIFNFKNYYRINIIRNNRNSFIFQNIIIPKIQRNMGRNSNVHNES